MRRLAAGSGLIMLVTRAENCVEVCGRRFHWVWLRDNCRCAQCCEPHSVSKLVDLGRLAGAPAAAQVRLDDRELVIDWAGDPPHRSTFAVPWLLAHAYDHQDGTAGDRVAGDGDARGRAGDGDGGPVLWDAATLRAQPPVWHDIAGCDPDGGPWTDALLRHGFALLSNVTQESLDRLATAIGPRHHTEHGALVTLQTVPGANSLAFSGHELTPHTDYSVHMHTPPLLQFMMCQRHDAVGGESVVVDGFRIAEELRRAHPAHFAMLATTAVNFEHTYAEHRYLFRRTRRIIELAQQGRNGAGGAGDVEGVYFAHSHAFTWDLPFDEMEAFYAAYYTFFDYVKSPAFQFRTLLRPGQCIAMRNGRVLHGRTAFDPSSGARTILDLFVEWDYLAGRLRFAAAAANP
jgi:alpha-ketoglutarate-dependent taurine dioxygenase